jgi:uncharacterized protein
MTITNEVEELERLPPGVAERLGHYVYLYVDPETGKPFYVGKGKGGRALAHMGATGESRKAQKLADLRLRGLRPRIEILAHALPSEEVAFRIEAAVIDLLGLEDLANLVGGWKSLQFGRIPLSELSTYYAAQPVAVTDAALLIRINKVYRHHMPGDEPYDGTRGCWKLGSRRAKARLALAVFHGIVREVYQIESWHQAGTTEYRSERFRHRKPSSRCEFVGAVAEAGVRERYFGKSVKEYFRQGQQSPVVYVNC